MNNIQQTGAVTTPAASQTGAAQALQKGQMNGVNVTAQTSAQSAMPDDEVAGKMLQQKAGKKLNIKSKKSEGMEKKQKTQKSGETQQTAKAGADPSNLEEVSLFKSAMKKLKNGEDLNQDEKDYLNNPDEDIYKTAEELVAKAVDMMDKEGRKNIYSRQIDNLNRKLSDSKDGNKKLDSKFWSDLNKFTSSLKMPGAKKKDGGESSREFITSLKELESKIASEYKASNKKHIVAVEIKKIGNEVAQTKDPERLPVLGKELHVLQTYLTMLEESDESEQNVARIHKLQVVDDLRAANDKAAIGG